MDERPQPKSIGSGASSGGENVAELASNFRSLLIAPPRAGRDYVRVAANAFVVHDGHVLLVEFLGGTDELHYNYPGGGVELDESLEDAVRREVREETTLEVHVERLLLVLQSVSSRNTNTMLTGEVIPWNEVRFFFLCAPVDGLTQARLPDVPDDGQTGVCWAPLDDLASLDILPRVSEHLVAAVRDPALAPRIVPNPPHWGAGPRSDGS